MHDWIDLELARQRQDELLREARERRMTRSYGRTPGRELTTRLRSLVRYLQPERNGGLAATEKPAVPIQGCSAD
jgi:hypothetical protein